MLEFSVSDSTSITASPFILKRISKKRLRKTLSSSKMYRKKVYKDLFVSNQIALSYSGQVYGPLAPVTPVRIRAGLYTRIPYHPSPGRVTRIKWIKILQKFCVMVHL